jgi:dimethylsulfide dehydrogenase subunit gamma/complex iron-sulfur molybdoenzyme family reductase subunit gamma
MGGALHHALLGLGFAAAIPGVFAAEAIRTIEVSRVSRAENAGSPDAPVWQRTQSARVDLQPAFPGHPYISGTPATREIAVQAVRTADVLYLRLRWGDASANTAASDTDRFVDGVAVQFPVNGKSSTTPFMGDGASAVNVWYWRADERVENLTVKGFGTVGRLPSQKLAGVSARRDDGWTVVLARPLAVRPGEGVALDGRRSIPIAFAAWDGANQERDGFKAVTLEWWSLKLR